MDLKKDFISKKPMQVLLSACFIGGVIFACYHFSSKPAVVAVPPLAVGVSEVIVGDLPINFEVPGKVYGSNETEVRAQVSGILKERKFKEGEYIEQGTVLFTIDKDKYLNAFDGAKGALAQAESEMKRAERDYKRTSKLFKENAVSQKQYDDTLSLFEKAKANVEIAKANLDTARINLDYTDVKAPISGIVRKEEKSIGNLINVAGLLTSMVQIKPLHIEFHLSGTFWNNMSKGYKNGVLKLLEPSDYKVQLIAADGTPSIETGKIIFIDSAEDPETGCISIKAEFPNTNKQFLPGQFVRVNVIGAAYTNVLIIPASSVISTAAGNIVYSIDESNTVTVKPVKVKFLKNYAIVFAGLKSGDKVITEGIIKARAGAKVTPFPKQFTVETLNNSNSSTDSAKTPKN